ncbi:MAG: type III secretion system export apparatus subunit SctV [Myxococcota bacterium]|nr:type III secretion system export apparatus subunit SctV [Myxococcota bacterium]MDW8361703.1 type III secretion system export apparatus subunit SctV [Myxococcales bacterium]
MKLGGLELEATGARGAARWADAALAAFVVVVVGMMILPLPTVLLDVLIAGNVSLAVLILLVALYVREGLAFASFPTILLVTTLYRLALNVSSTRLILLQADAGEVIYAFGNFVVRGNYVVGAVVFLILTLIQFIVIAKGSERVAEVGARFTLDAMPGKQMSIDAELRSGAISQDEARRRRRLLARESQFYGAMDGAMKFVKGDAIAGIVITVVNIVGGLAIGVAMRDMSAVDALETYGLLTIGDGLVSQIPALLISTAAGIVVTRVASEHEEASLGGDVAQQIFGDPRALRVATIFLVVLAIVPGLPALPFLVLAAVLFVVSRRATARARVEAAETPVLGAARQEAVRESRARAQMVPLVVPVSVDLGEALGREVLGPDGRGGPLLEEHIPTLREALFLDLGLALPGVRARAVPGLADREYVVAVQEVPAGRGEVPTDRVWVAASSEAMASLGLSAEPAPDPVGRGPAVWVPTSGRALVEEAGFEVLDPAALLARHVGAVVRRRAADFVGLQEAQAMLDQLERAYPALVRAVVPKPVPLPLLADVLRRLVEEGVSIRPLREILEALGTFAPTEKDPVVLCELVRASLRRHITHRYAPTGVLTVFLLDAAIEDAVRDAIQRTPTGSYLAMAPEMARDVIGAVRREVQALDTGAPPVLLTQSDVRRFVRRLLEVDLPDVVVLSYQELAPEVTVQPLARIAL